MNISKRSFKCILALVVMFSVMSVQAQQAPEWEYLVVSYGTTYFSNPALDLTELEASRSKILLFSELGITMPNEATSLQRNIDVLGRFSWELVAVVGSIGGDQQLVFKRPYDAERSAVEAERIQSEREALLASYEATRSVEPDGASPLVDLDAVDRARAVEARKTQDEGRVRYLFEQAAGWGFVLPELTVESRSRTPDGDPEVWVEVVLDATAAAVVAPGQYRSSLAAEAFDGFVAALKRVGFVEPEYGFCLGDPAGEVTMSVSLALAHEGRFEEIGSRFETMCF